MTHKYEVHYSVDGIPYWMDVQAIDLADAVGQVELANEQQYVLIDAVFDENNVQVVGDD